MDGTPQRTVDEFEREIMFWFKDHMTVKDTFYKEQWFSIEITAMWQRKTVTIMSLVETSPIMATVSAESKTYAGAFEDVLNQLKSLGN